MARTGVKTAAKKVPGKRVGKRTGSTGPAPPAPREPHQLPAVRVRMYRQGLGDCFLLTFDVGGDEAHMLIDCGTLGALTTGVTMASVVADIRGTTGDHLDALVVTHEHKDHVSGFASQQAAFAAMDVDQVWLAWTENPKDRLAKKIARDKRDLAAALVRTTQALTEATASAASKAVGLAVRDVLGFGGDPSAGAGFAETINHAMSFVRTELAPRTRYFKPGDGPVTEEWLNGFRIYVLGPPLSENDLNQTGSHGSPDLYGLAGSLGAGAALRASGRSATDYLAAADPDDRAAFQNSQPFDPRFRLERDSSRARQTFPDYFAGAAAWRGVNDDWMHMASDLAMQLDGATNNTSLALAIERIGDGRVLVFPADAQQGNWLSWQGMAWTVTDDGRTRPVSAADLLARAVFYKVGHHGSHNGTVSTHGLELMQEDQELTAFIPVDRAVALSRNPKGSWRMPAVTLYRALLDKCQGRVVRSDIGWADDARAAANSKVESELVGVAPPVKWTSWRKSQRAASHVTITDLFVDYLLT
jgi:glyoxylase-like metal-dependent hydrolase (beta-lactamase superfamily II)